MAHRLTKEAITTYVPAVEEVIASPAYTTVTYERRAVTTYTGGAVPSGPVPQYGYVTDENGKKKFGIVGFYLPVTGKPTTTYVDVPIYTYHPAVVGIPGRDSATITDNQLGWNAGAQSADVLTGDFVVQCILQSESLGVLVGIQPAAGPSASFSGITHGVLIAQSQPPSVVESGVVRASGALGAGAIPVTIERISGLVRITAGGLLSYSSQTASFGDMRISAVLYAGSDYVDDPVIATVAVMESSGDWQWGDGADIPQLRASSTWGWGGYGSINDGFASMVIGLDLLSSDVDLDGATWVLDDPQLTASGFSDIDLSVAAMILPLTMSALAISIDLGTVSMSVPMSMRSGDYDYGDAAIMLDGIEVYALSTEDPPGYETASEAAGVGDFYIVDPTAYLTLMESVKIGSGLEMLLQMDADLADHLVLMDETNIGLIISALLDNRLGVADISLRRDVSEYVDATTGISGLYDFTGNTYATNIATGAASRFAGFDFDGFCRVGMDTYAYRRDGLYLIGGGVDQGAFIGARADFFAEDFGTAQGKRVGNIFMGLATDGQVYVRTVEDGGQEMTYRAYNRRGEFRADMQRGRASRFWRLRLEVVEGNYAELDNVEWVVTQTGRRSS